MAVPSPTILQPAVGTRCHPENLTGTVPDPSVFTVLKAGDPVVATSMGGAGGTWIGVAKVFPTPGIENWLATDIIGDPDSLPVNLAADYSFSYTTTPECGNCTGSVCNALSAADHPEQYRPDGPRKDPRPGRESCLQWAE